MSTTVGPVGNFPRNAHADNFMTAISEGPRRDVLQLAPAESTCDTHLLYNCSNIEKSDEIKVMGAPKAGKYSDIRFISNWWCILRAKGR